ncbi:MAG: hypothetical protein OEY56_04045 [Cyclobacteriaceae bacterium]|nr:hypothetical protein [Cyclobacteriaceae bacterium]
MKFLKYNLILLFTIFMVLSCTDESLIPEPEPETAVHGYVTKTTDIENFLYQDVSLALDLDFQWVSVDNKNTVDKIEFYITFTEVYTDFEKGSKTANHGTVLYKTIEGAAVPANRTNTSFTISQADVHALFSTAQYAYDVTAGADPAVNVFGTSIKPNRNLTTSPFVDGDSFKLTWVIYTADGRKFDTWNDSICLEFPGANCNFSWAVTCSQTILSPPGDYTLVLNDSYGDGWNGAALNVVIDGTATSYTLANGSNTSYVVTVPAGTTTLTFEFVSGSWDSEVTYTITSPKGNVIAAWGPSPPVGTVVLNLCNE